MAGLFGGKSQAAQTPAVTGLQVQTSSYGKVIPVVYGRTRMAPNLIWYNNFVQHGSGGGKGGGKGGIGGCFAGDTYVSLPPNGKARYRCIANIQAGDKVMSYDPENDCMCEGTVTETHRHLLEETNNSFITVVLDDGTSIRPTDNHYFLRLDEALVEIGQYREGDVVMCEDGELREIVKIDRIAPQDEYSYNLTVSPHHNYVANTVLVHNGGGGKSSKTTTYSADIMYAVCEGPIDAINACWNDKTEQSPGSIGLSIISGAYGQSPWGYLASSDPSQSLGYSGVALAVAQSFNLGQSANLPNVNFEVDGILAGTALNGTDADTALVVQDILTNVDYGIGLLSGEVGTIVQAQETLTVTSSTVTVSAAASFMQNLSVTLGGVLLTCVAASPSASEYTFSAGVYSFDPSLDGSSVTVNYTWLTGLNQFGAWCELEGLWISPAYTDQTQGNSVLADIAKFTFSEFVWSSGVLTLVPRGTIGMSGGGYTYHAPVVQFDLTDDDYMLGMGGSSGSSSNDPIIVTRLRQSDQDNTVQVEFVDRANQYATAIAEATDQAMIDQFRRRFSGSQTGHIFADIGAANLSAQLLLQKEYVRNTYAVTLPQQFVILDPMDVVTLTDSYLGLNQLPVRVLEMSENDDGSISFVMEQIPHGTGTTAVYSWNAGTGYSPNFAWVPGNVNTPAIFNAPSIVSNGLPQVWIAVSNTDPAYGGCNVWVSSDGTSYTLIGSIMGQSTMGATITSTFPVGSDPDTTHTLHVNLTESSGTLTSYTSADADNGVSLCYLGADNGGEFIAFETATLTSAHHYDIGTYIRRGMYGSSNASHATGTLFTRCDSTILKYTYPSNFTGNTIFLKFTSFNVFGNGEQVLSGVTAYTHDLTGVPTVLSIGTTSLSLTPKTFTP